MPLPTALVSHPACKRHDTGPGHPESRVRLPVLLEAVRRDADLAPHLQERQARPAEEEDLLRVHTPEHVVWIRKGAAEARRRGEILWLDPDTAVSPDSWDAALADR
jgi:acetoin utilization deacetylase AcuC-like enzyme